MNHVNLTLIFLGLLLLVLAYLIGVKKYTWLLSGFNQHRVRDKEKLAQITGMTNLISAVVLIAAGFLTSPYASAIVPIVVVGQVIVLLYVNTKMVD